MRTAVEERHDAPYQWEGADEEGAADSLALVPPGLRKDGQPLVHKGLMRIIMIQMHPLTGVRTFRRRLYMRTLMDNVMLALSRRLLRPQHGDFKTIS